MNNTELTVFFISTQPAGLIFGRNFDILFSFITVTLFEGGQMNAMTSVQKCQWREARGEGQWSETLYSGFWATEAHRSGNDIAVAKLLHGWRILQIVDRSRIRFETTGLLNIELPADLQEEITRFLEVDINFQRGAGVMLDQFMSQWAKPDHKGLRLRESDGNLVVAKLSHGWRVMRVQNMTEVRFLVKDIEESDLSEVLWFVVRHFLETDQEFQRGAGVMLDRILEVTS